MSAVPGSPAPARHEPAFPNTTHIARREYGELVRSRLFHVSTVTLAVLAIVVALLPIAVRALERGSTTRIAVVATTERLAVDTRNVLDEILNTQGGTTYTVAIEPDEAAAIKAVDDHRLDGVVSATRAADSCSTMAIRSDMPWNRPLPGDCG